MPEPDEPRWLAFARAKEAAREAAIQRLIEAARALAVYPGVFAARFQQSQLEANEVWITFIAALSALDALPEGRTEVADA